MKGLSILSLVVAAALIVFGVYQIFTKKTPLANKERYTKESIEDFAVRFGVLNIGFGIGFFMIFEGISGAILGQPNAKLTFYGDILVILLVFAQMFFVKPALKEKPKKTTAKGRKIASNKAVANKKKK